MATREKGDGAAGAETPKRKRGAGSRRASSRLYTGSEGGMLQRGMHRPRLELRRLSPPGKDRGY